MRHANKLVRKTKKMNVLIDNAVVSLAEAMAAVSSIGGTIFSVKLKESDEKTVWRIKILRDGEQVKIDVDAASGDIIKAMVAVGGTEQQPV